MSELLFTGGTVVTAEGSYRADVLVEDGRVSAVGKAKREGSRARQTGRRASSAQKLN